MIPTSTSHFNFRIPPQNEGTPNRSHATQWRTKDLNDLFTRVDGTEYKNKEDNEFYNACSYCLNYLKSPRHAPAFSGVKDSEQCFLVIKNDDEILAENRNDLLDMALHFKIKKKPNAAEILWSAVRLSYPTGRMGVEIPEVDAFSGRVGFLNTHTQRKDLLQAAEIGRPVAQFCCWYMREELKIDENTAYENLTRSAQQGYPLASEALKTASIPVSAPTPQQVAQEDFLQAVNLKDSQPVTAINIFKKAAAANHPEAAFELGKLFSKAKNYKEAIKFYKMALIVNHSEAHLELAKIYDQQYRESLLNIGGFSFSFSLSALLPDAINSYSAYISAGKGVHIMLAKRQCLQLKAEAKFKDDQFALGQKYLHGDVREFGIGKDHVKAELYFKDAADQGHAEAAFTLYELYQEKRAKTSSHYLNIAVKGGHEEARRISNEIKAQATATAKEAENAKIKAAQEAAKAKADETARAAAEQAAKKKTEAMLEKRQIN